MGIDSNRSVSQVGSTDRHMVQLDSLRAIAAMAVLVQHSYPVPGINLGFAGVKLFFVLSGFLITGILLRERDRIAEHSVSRTSALRTFYIRRILRIFPLYYLAILLAVIFSFPGIDESLVWHLTYSSNYLLAWNGDWGAAPLALGHFWSLAVEEQFYLLWPAVILITPRRRLIVILVAIIVFGPISRFVIFQSTHKWLSAMVVTTSCFDSLGLGGLLAVLFHGNLSADSCRRQARIKKLARIGLFVGITVYVALTIGASIGRGYQARVVFQDFALSLIFFWLVSRGATGFGGVWKVILESRLLVYLGTISYGIYVYHGIIPNIAEYYGLHFPDYVSVEALIVLPATTIPIAALSWMLFENPLNRLKRYFPYGEARGESP